jgi:hypothetical protein
MTDARTRRLIAAFAAAYGRPRPAACAPQGG